jgi:hypothetical protein
MRARRRRTRRPDPLATPAGVRSVCQALRERCPALIPNSERQLIKLLEAVRHIERRPATDTRRGRPPRWERQHLLEVARHLKAVLERETSGRISLQSFTGHYLRLLHFPADVQAALERGDINLGEAAQLARLTDRRLDTSPQKAYAIRAELLRRHLLMKGSETALRARVRELLGEVVEVSSQVMAQAVQKADALLEVDPADKRHLFYEEMKRLFYAMRAIQPEDVDDESLEEFMAAADQLSNAIHAIELKRQRREQKVRKLLI